MSSKKCKVSLQAPEYQVKSMFQAVFAFTLPPDIIFSSVVFEKYNFEKLQSEFSLNGLASI